jgi:hypothetical protein
MKTFSGLSVKKPKGLPKACYKCLTCLDTGVMFYTVEGYEHSVRCECWLRAMLDGTKHPAHYDGSRHRNKVKDPDVMVTAESAISRFRKLLADGWLYNARERMDR